MRCKRARGEIQIDVGHWTREVEGPGVRIHCKWPKGPERSGGRGCEAVRCVPMDLRGLRAGGANPTSYTHLTLPAKGPGELSAAPVSIETGGLRGGGGTLRTETQWPCAGLEAGLRSLAVLPR